MTASDLMLLQPAISAVGWALVHFVWQGALIGLVAAVALALLRRSAPDVRYVVATIAMSLMFTLPVVTAVQIWSAAGVERSVRASAADSTSPRVRSSAPLASGGAVVRASATGAVDAAPRPAATSAPLDSRQVERWLPLLVMAWLAGVALLTLRLVNGWLWVQRLRSRGTSPAGNGLQRAATRLLRHLHIRRRVDVLQSSVVDVPTVIGWMRPVVLLPLSALSGLAPHQLEAVLAHELAHVRRQDYLVNLLQTLVETLLFYHPAVWWLSLRIRQEREHCCDDLAVSLCGDPLAYARALADLEVLRGQSGQLVLAATGGSLLQRVRRLVGAPSHAGPAPGWLAGTASVLLIVTVAMSAATSDAVRPAGRSAGTPDAPAAPILMAGGPALSLSTPAMAVRPAPSAGGQAGADALRALPGHVLGAARDLAEDLRTFLNTARADLAPQIPPLPPLPPAPPDPVAQGSAGVGASAGAGVSAGAGEAQAALDAARSLADQARAEQPSLASAELTHAGTASSRALGQLSESLSPAAAAAALAPSAGIGLGGQSHGSFTWSNNGDKLEVKYDGELEFTDDDADVKRLSPGGLLRVKDGGWLGGHTAEFTADNAGTITRRYWAGLGERPFEPEGRQWLAQVLPRFIRQSGIGAPGRVARFLRSGGQTAVLAEISRIEGSYGKRIYFRELIRQGSLDAAALRQVLTQAGREIDSDFELASLLVDNVDTLLANPSVQQAYFDAARSIQSDFEMRRVFSSALKRGPVTPAVLAGILETSRNIDSDFEEASLLVQVAKLQSLDQTTRPAFFAALATVQSDFEHRRVLSSLAERSAPGAEVTASMLESAASVSSDFECASLLVQIAKQQPIEGMVRAPFFRAVESIQSAFERGRVLQAVSSRSDASDETLLLVLRAAKGMGSSFETSQVLQKVAAGHSLTGASRDAYIDAAERLGDFEQGRALSALVRSERRK